MKNVLVPPKIVRAHKDGSTDIYFIRQSVGKGGFSTVFEALLLKTNETFAVKAMSLSNLRGKGQMKRQQEEIKIQSSLNHPNILRAYDFFQDGVNFYIILEYCPYHSVYNLFKQYRKFSELDTADIIKQVLEGVLYLQKKSIIHRDIKPQNLLIGSDGKIKISDFGISIKLSSKIDRCYSTCGTYGFMCPEMINKEHNGYSFESDIWAIGVCTFLLLTGTHPFLTLDKLKTEYKILHGEYQFPPNCNLSSESKDFIRTILQTNPKNRPTIDTLLHHPFITNSQKKPHKYFFQTLVEKSEKKKTQEKLPALLSQKNPGKLPSLSHQKNIFAQSYIPKQIEQADKKQQHPEEGNKYGHIARIYKIKRVRKVKHSDKKDVKEDNRKPLNFVKAEIFSVANSPPMKHEKVQLPPLEIVKTDTLQIKQNDTDEPNDSIEEEDQYSAPSEEEMPRNSQEQSRSSLEQPVPSRKAELSPLLQARMRKLILNKEEREMLESSEDDEEEDMHSVQVKNEKRVVKPPSKPQTQPNPHQTKHIKNEQPLFLKFKTDKLILKNDGSDSSQDQEDDEEYSMPSTNDESYDEQSVVKPPNKPQTHPKNIQNELPLFIKSKTDKLILTNDESYSSHEDEGADEHQYSMSSESEKPVVKPPKSDRPRTQSNKHQSNRHNVELQPTQKAKTEKPKKEPIEQHNRYSDEIDYIYSTSSANDASANNRQSIPERNDRSQKKSHQKGELPPLQKVQTEKPKSKKESYTRDDKSNRSPRKEKVQQNEPKQPKKEDESKPAVQSPFKPSKSSRTPRKEKVDRSHHPPKEEEEPVDNNRFQWIKKDRNAPKTPKPITKPLQHPVKPPSQPKNEQTTAMTKLPPLKPVKKDKEKDKDKEKEKDKEKIKEKEKPRPPSPSQMLLEPVEKYGRPQPSETFKKKRHQATENDKIPLNLYTIPNYCIINFVANNQTGEIFYFMKNGQVGMISSDQQRLVLDPFGEFIQIFPRIETYKPEILNPEKEEDVENVSKLLNYAKIFKESNLHGLEIPSKKLPEAIPMRHVKYCMNNEKGMMFRMDNRVSQVNFPDKSKLIVFWEQKALISAHSLFRNGLFMTFENLKKSGNEELKKKYSVAKEMVELMCK